MYGVAFVWNMFDFQVTEIRISKERTNNKKVLVYYDHKTRKEDSFYFYKAELDKNDKFVYITSKKKNRKNSK